MSAESVARKHYAGRSGLTDAIADLAARVWRKVRPKDLDASWAKAGPELVVGVAGAQLAAARTADAYVDAELEEQDGQPGADDRVNPSALAGIASDGRPLDSLLRNAILTVKASIATGADIDRAMAAGLANAMMIARTQVADAGRVADGVALAARHTTGYVRMLVGDSCSRCVVLAGRHYEWNQGFERHPNCDCIHVPAAEALDDITTNPRVYFESLSEAEQNKAFTISGAQAIRDGADIAQVVNARRGALGLNTAGGRVTAEEAAMLREGRSRGRLQRTNVFGEDLFITTEGTTSRGFAGSRLGARETGVKTAGQRYRRARAPRLMPESIYEIANGDRDEALRLLRRNGYLIDRKPAPSTARPAPAERTVPQQRATPPEPEPTPEPIAPASTRVQGADHLADEAARLDAAGTSFHDIELRAREARWDPALGDIGKRQGFDGLPQDATRDEVDAAVARGWTEVWRGVQGSDTGDSAADINARFRSGAYEPGRGTYGNGWYLSERRVTAEVYRGRDPMTNFPAGGGPDYELSEVVGEEMPDSLLRIAISPAARVIDLAELTQLRDRWLDGRPAEATSVKVLTDLGRFAASLGYDAIRIADGSPDGAFYPGWEDEDLEEPPGAPQWVLLNRTVLMVQRVEDAP